MVLVAMESSSDTHRIYSVYTTLYIVDEEVLSNGQTVGIR